MCWSHQICEWCCRKQPESCWMRCWFCVATRFFSIVESLARSGSSMGLPYTRYQHDWSLLWWRTERNFWGISLAVMISYGTWCWCCKCQEFRPTTSEERARSRSGMQPGKLVLYSIQLENNWRETSDVVIQMNNIVGIIVWGCLDSFGPLTLLYKINWLVVVVVVCRMLPQVAWESDYEIGRIVCAWNCCTGREHNHHICCLWLWHCSVRVTLLQ